MKILRKSGKILKIRKNTLEIQKKTEKLENTPKIRKILVKNIRNSEKCQKLGKILRKLGNILKKFGKIPAIH